MGDLLLNKELLTSHEDSEVRILAQAQTHTVLATLSSERKRSVLIFLYRTNLLLASEPIITLERANLSAVNLQGANLRGAHLADAELSKEQLGTAWSLKGATMPDGSVHD